MYFFFIWDSFTKKRNYSRGKVWNTFYFLLYFSFIKKKKNQNVILCLFLVIKRRLVCLFHRSLCCSFCSKLCGILLFSLIFLSLFAHWMIPFRLLFSFVQVFFLSSFIVLYCSVNLFVLHRMHFILSCVFCLLIFIWSDVCLFVQYFMYWSFVLFFVLFSCSSLFNMLFPVYLVISVCSDLFRYFILH